MPQPKLHLTTHRLNPAEAEIRIDGAADVTGRLMGPRCHYASTVEVPYYVKQMPDGSARALVPEPSCWDPQTPFLYEAILRIGGGETIKRRYGLRMVELSAARWRVNRKPFLVDGVVRHELHDAAELRAAGVNTILCPATTATASVWDQADVLGFFVLGLLPNEAHALGLAQELKEHPSCLGWIVDEADFIGAAALQSKSRHEPFFGLRVTAPVATPPWIHFLAGPASLAQGGLPWLQLLDGNDASADAPLGQARL